MIKIKKQIKVKNSPLFEEQLEELRNIIREKDNKFHKQLLTAIEREKDNLAINPQQGIQIRKKQIPKIYIIKYMVSQIFGRLTCLIIGG